MHRFCRVHSPRPNRGRARTATRATENKRRGCVIALVNALKMDGAVIDAIRRRHLFGVSHRFAVHQLGWVAYLGGAARHPIPATLYRWRLRSCQSSTVSPAGSSSQSNLEGSVRFVGWFPAYRYRFASPALKPMGSLLIIPNRAQLRCFELRLRRHLPSESAQLRP